MDAKRSALLHASVLSALLALAPAPGAEAEERKVSAALELADQFCVERKTGEIASRGAAG